MQQGYYRDILGARNGQFAAVTAIDLLEHLTKDKVLTAFAHVAAALAPNGVFVARVRNAVSPFGGNILYGDFAPESWYTERSDRHVSALCKLALAAETGSLRGHLGHPER